MNCSVEKCGMETTSNNNYWTLHYVFNVDTLSSERIKLSVMIRAKEINHMCGRKASEQTR